MNTHATPHILIVDDDPAVRELVVEYLSGNDLRASAVASGRALFQRFDSEAIDLVLLDLKLPGGDGLQPARVAVDGAPARGRGL